MDAPKKIRHIPPHEQQGPTIRITRQSQHLTQAQLARAIGCSQQHVSLLERNERCASARTAGDIERVLGIPALPLPRMLLELTALGRQAKQEAQRQAEEQRLRVMRAPQVVAYWPTPRWH